MLHKKKFMDIVQYMLEIKKQMTCLFLLTAELSFTTWDKMLSPGIYQNTNTRCETVAVHPKDDKILHWILNMNNKYIMGKIKIRFLLICFVQDIFYNALILSVW